MSSGLLPQLASGESAENGTQMFAGITHEPIYFGDTNGEYFLGLVPDTTRMAER